MTANKRDYRRQNLATIARLTNLEPTYAYRLHGEDQPVFIPYAHTVRYLLQSVEADPTVSVSGDALYAAFTRWAATQPAPLDDKLPVKIQRVDFHRHLNRFLTTFGTSFTLDATATVQTIQGCSFRATALNGNALQEAINALKTLDEIPDNVAGECRWTPGDRHAVAPLKNAGDLIYDMVMESGLVFPRKRYKTDSNRGR